MSTTVHQILKKHFGFDEFRPMQQEIIEAALQGNDVLALMPTSGGKSLCYQITALALDGLCLVISPLVALMNDQVQSLRKKNITAFSIHTGMQQKEIISILETVIHSNCKFLYVSPERLETPIFKEYLPGLGVSLIAVDEAHCISQWGYDFRPSYLRIVRLREELPHINIIALTASATPLVQQDLCEKLSLNTENRFRIFRQSFERPNLSYSAIKVDAGIPKIVSVLKSVQGSAIVYCKTRKRSKEISQLLNAQNLNTDFYNAGLSYEERLQKQQSWFNNEIRVMVCTNAFGMGIDKPDVRLVIHADIPDALESYYQEAGRAGRDGQKSYAVLLYNSTSLEELKALPNLRYPDVESIRNVYRNVVHYLQLPEGEEPGHSYDFNLKDFIKKFPQDIQSTIFGLKALEQNGWLSFNEQVFSPAKVRFNIYKNDLYEYEKNFPQFEPLIKSLLRTYEGIYDYPVAISENYIAHLLKYDITIVKEQLQQLHIDRIIIYEPQKDDPQITLTQTRVKTTQLYIDTPEHNKRKNIFSERINKIIDYVNDEKNCRSKVISSYFGDQNIGDCGICDNCLKKKKPELGQTQFNNIAHALSNLLQSPINTEALLEQLQQYPQEHVWTVINFWIEEGKIIIEPGGEMHLAK